MNESQAFGGPVLVRTTKGRIHRGTLTEAGQLLTYEGCNLDDAEGHELVGPEALEMAEPGQLCENDFPDVA